MAEQALAVGFPSSGGGPKSSLDRVTKALADAGLAVRQVRTDSFRASCPVHNDSSPSLHVSWRRGQGSGAVLLFCHGCQARTEDLVEAIGLTMGDLFDEPLPERAQGFGRIGKSPAQRRAGKRRGKLGPLPARISADTAPVVDEAHEWREVTRYPYVDHEGRLIQEVIREECTAEGARHKQFRQLFVTREGRRVKRKPDEFYPVLYRAPQVLAAVRAGAEVWLLEGEKDVESAEALGLVATTNTQGGKSFPAELAEELRGARVVVVLDHDDTGWARGVDLHTKLSAVGARVRLVLPAVDQNKADFTDHVEAGYGVDDFLDVTVAEAAAWHALYASLSAVRVKGKAVLSAAAEAQARQELADEGQETEENTRFAKRWALESQIRHEALHELVGQTHGHAAHAGTAWATEATTEADQILADCTEAARRSHRTAGVPVPQLLLAAEAPSDEASAEAPASPTDVALAAVDALAGASGVALSQPVFRILDGKIVQWEASSSGRRSQDDEEEDGPAGKFKPLLSMVVRVVAREYLEVDEAQDVEHAELLGRSSAGRRKASAPRTLVAVRLQYHDAGELIEIRVMADQWRDHTWLDSLPGPVDYDHKRAGLDTLQRAILAVSEDVSDEILHRSTGWRENPDGTHRYIHARGAITPDGHEDTPAAFSGALQRYDLPDPVRNPEVLREAWFTTSATMLERLPVRVSGPLLGHMFRAAQGHNPWVLSLVGPPGSYKTSVAAKAMHHFGERWEHSKPSASMSGNGDTFNALRLKLHAAKDTVVWMDDFAPTKSWLEAQKHLEETARLIHNQEERERNTRDGQGNMPGTAPRASGLFTSEVMPRPGSASERMLVVPLAREDVDTDLLFPLDEPLSRHGRALLMSSYISWLAGDLTARRTRYTAIAAAYADELVKASGQTVRQANAVANTWIGWVAMCEFLLEVGAISEEEREDTLVRVNDGMHDACRAAINPDMPRTTGARVRELLAYALRQGIAYVDDVRTGECPPWPLAGRLGWRRTLMSEYTEHDSMNNPARYRLDRSGIRLGYVLHDPTARERGRTLMCDSTQLEAVLKSASATQAERLEIDRNTASRALHEEGVLIPDTSEGRVRHTVKCKIYAVGDRVVRMVALHLDKVIGEDLDEDDDVVEPEGDGPNGGPGGGTRPPGPRTDGGGAGGAAPVAPLMIPGLWSDGPQNLDATAAPVQAQEVAGNHRDDSDGADHPTEEGPMSIQQPGGAAAAAAPRTSARQAEPTEGFRAAAAILDVDGIWASDGRRYKLLPGGPNHIGDLVSFSKWLNLGTQITKYRTAGGQVWLGDEMARRLGIDVDAIHAAADKDKDKVAREVTKGIPALTDALERGYSIGGRDGDSLGRWTRVWKGTEKSVWVVLMAALPSDDIGLPLTKGEPDHAHLARRIGLLSDALGHPFQLSGSTTGLDLMQAVRGKPDERAFFAVHEPVPPAQQANIEVDLTWSRRPTEDELKHEWIHAYDRSGSYLAGVSGLELGVGEAVHHPEGTKFAPRVPGYWRIEIPESSDWRMPNPLDPRGTTAGKTRWVTTPALEFALEQEYAPEILEAYTWQKRARIFDPWYERVRDARTGLDVDDEDSQIARDQLKMIYASTIGMLGSQLHMAGREGYAPERRHMIVAKARTNILRRVAKIGRETGRWPVAIITDTVLYTSPDPDPIASWPGGQQTLGRELGRYKHEGSAPLQSQLEFLTGGPYKGKDAIVRPVLGAE